MHDVDPAGLLESACGAARGTGATGDWHEAELASELLELTSERELGRFLRDLIRGAAPDATGAHRGAEPALGAILRRAATRVLPLAGQPPGGTGRASSGTPLADRAGAPLGLELEGLSAQDREFELARQFVRFARAAAGELAGRGPRSSADGEVPADAARAAAIRAAARHAPGLMAVSAAGPSTRQTVAPGQPGDTRLTCCRSGPLRTGHSARMEAELGGNMMYQTEPRQGEYGRRSRRGRRWQDSESEGHHAGYGAAEQEFLPLPPFNPVPPFGNYGFRHWRRRRWGDFEGEARPDGHGAGEQQFLPILPLIGSLLGGLLKETEDEFSGESEYGPGEYGSGESEYGPGEYGSGESEYGSGESEYGPGEYGPGGYGESEYGPGEYGSGESEYGPGGYGESEYGPGEYGSGESEYGPGEYGSGESEYGPGEYGPGEYGQSEYGPGEYGETGLGETEQFLGSIFKRILGGEMEQAGSALSPAHESELASRLLEVSSEGELENFLANIVSTVGRAIGGIRDFAASPAGQAVVQAVRPLAKAALPAVGAAIGSAVAPGAGSAVGRALGTAASSLFEIGEVTGEQGEYEMARRVVQLTSAAARSAALAPPGVPPEAVGEISLFRASRRFAPGFYRRGLHRFRPYARRYGGSGYRRRYGGYGRRYGGYRGGYGRPGPAVRRIVRSAVGPVVWRRLRPADRYRARPRRRAAARGAAATAPGLPLGRGAGRRARRWRATRTGCPGRSRRSRRPRRPRSARGSWRAWRGAAARSGRDGPLGSAARQRSGLRCLTDDHRPARHLAARAGDSRAVDQAGWRQTLRPAGDARTRSRDITGGAICDRVLPDQGETSGRRAGPRVPRVAARRRP